MQPLKRDREEFELDSPKQILIFDDAGCASESIRAIASQLTSLFSCTVEAKSAEYLKTHDWEKNTFALVMGGGECSRWDERLGTEGIERIRRYVTRGGRYLGICAGAYFAARESIFCLSGTAAIKKTRSLAFFDGIASGPIKTSDNHLSPSAALAVKINLLSQKTGKCYYQGGCSFNILEDSELTRVIACYEKPYQGSCIIRSIVGEGKAILCGLHPEFLWKPEYSAATPIALKLAKHEPFRQTVWQSMVSELL